MSYQLGARSAAMAVLVLAAALDPLMARVSISTAAPGDVSAAGASGCSLTYDAACEVVVKITGPVWYVDNSAPPGGDGSAANPFDELADAEAAAGPGEVILVRHGDGTSNGQDEGIVLQDGQCLLGEDEPVVTNSAGPAVTLADHNVVAGMVIENVDGAGDCGPPLESQGYGILGDGVAGFEIAGNRFSTNECFGVLINNGSQTGISSCNHFEANLAGLAAFNDDGGTLDLMVEQNVLTDTVGLGGVLLAVEDLSELTATIRDNQISGVGGAGDGIVLEQHPLADEDVDGEISARILGNHLQGLGSAIEIEASGNVEIEVDASSNVIEEAFDDAVDVELDGFSIVRLHLDDNTIDGVDDEAVNLEVRDSAQLDAWLIANRIRDFDRAGDEGAGIDLTVMNVNPFPVPVVAEVTIRGNEISDSATGVGVRIDAPPPEGADTFVIATIAKNCVARTRLGIDVDVANTFTRVDITENLVTNNQDAGIQLGIENGSPTFVARVVHNTLAGNGVSPNGFRAAALDGLLCLVLQQNSSDTDFFLLQQDPGVFVLESPAINDGTVVIDGNVIPVDPGTCGFELFADGFESGDLSAWSNGLAVPSCDEVR